MLTKNAELPDILEDNRIFDWELDEVKRAALRQQRETTPYPSQMNSLPDDFEDYAPQATLLSPEKQKPTI
jgi:hypothetical protein